MITQLIPTQKTVNDSWGSYKVDGLKILLLDDSQQVCWETKNLPDRDRVRLDRGLMRLFKYMSRSFIPGDTP